METLGVQGDNYKLDGFNHVDNTVNHGSFKVEKFSGFHSFYMIRETFLHGSSRWRCSNMDLRESMWDSTKVFSRRSVCTTCHETFLP